MNSTTLFPATGGPANGPAIPVYAVPKFPATAPAALTPIATFTAGPNYTHITPVGATEQVLVWQSANGSQAGMSYTYYSCVPYNCEATLRSLVSVSSASNTYAAFDPVNNRLLVQDQSLFEVKYVSLADPVLTSFSPPMRLASGRGLWVIDGFVYGNDRDPGGFNTGVLDRAPLDGSTEARTVAMGATVSYGDVFGTSIGLFWADAFPVWVPLPSGAGEPLVLDGATPITREGGAAGLAGDENDVYWVDGAGMLVTCPIRGCDGPPRPMANVAGSAWHMVVDSDALYWLTYSPGNASTSVYRLPR